MELEELYARADEGMRLAKSRAHALEYFTTVSVLSDCIDSRTRIIELGAGTGVYGDAFRESCLSYHATDLLQKHVDVLKARFARCGNVRVSRRDAAAPFDCNEEYDLVLCLGPLYHLQDRKERLGCLENCRNLCADKGTVAISYISRLFGPAEYGSFESCRNGELSRLDDFLGLSHFHTPEEMEREASDAGLQVVDHVRTDGPCRNITCGPAGKKACWA